MFRLDDNLLRELGLGDLPIEEKNKMLAHIYETLEMRVGMRLAEQMTDQQLDEFEAFIDKNDEAGALAWLESNFPNYKQTVADELDKLKAEIKQHAPAIVEAARQDQLLNTQQNPPTAMPAPGVEAPQQPYSQPVMADAGMSAPQAPQTPSAQPTYQPQPPIDPYAQAAMPAAPANFAQPQPGVAPQMPSPADPYAQPSAPAPTMTDPYATMPGQPQPQYQAPPAMPPTFDQNQYAAQQPYGQPQPPAQPYQPPVDPYANQQGYSQPPAPHMPPMPPQQPPAQQ